ncbi:MAG TPA: response regulator transcription factor [Bryobacteraceae bacterium]|jgi:DNA-binding NarL/FixJ family response regulator|nr:response regulator transcription factor [Bryobacteraceae bacterium]
MERPRVLLADDHVLVVEGLSKLLQDDMDLVGTASSGTEAVEKAALLQPDVVLMDISMPGLNGFDAAKQMKSCAPRTKVIAVTMHRSTAYLRESLRAGMSGFVLKQSAASELADAVSTVMRDERYVTPLVTQQTESQGVNDGERALTLRQREVLRLIAQGRIAKEIATALNISVRTAEFHRVSIMQRLGLRTTAELTRFALENGIVE